jgi:hypothetical protein
MQLINRDRALAIVCLLSAMIFFATLHFEAGGTLTPLAAWHSLDTTVLVAGILCIGFLNYAWHWPLFRGWLVNVPLLYGTWDATIRLTYQTNEMPSGDEILRGIVTIRQSLFCIGVTLTTQRSVSHSFASAFDWSETTQRCRLVYSYSSEPRLRDRIANPRHDGTAVLDIASSTVLEGKYFTDRGSQGEMRLQRL